MWPKTNTTPILGGFALRYSTLSFLCFYFIFCETWGYHSGVGEVLVSLDVRLSLGSRLSRTRPHIPEYPSLRTSCHDESFAMNLIYCSTRVLLELTWLTEELELHNWLGLEIFLLFTAARMDLGPAQNGYRGIFPPKLNDQDVSLTIRSHLVSRLRMHGTICPLTQLLN